MTWTKPASLLLLALTLPAISGFDRTFAGHGVHDQAGLFSAPAIRQAEQAITQIHSQFRKDVLVETFAGVPLARMGEYERDRESFFSSFLRDRARDAQVNGVYVLILKESPPHSLRVQVGAGSATRQQLFHLADQDEVVRMAKAGLRSGDYDRTLRDSVSAIGDAFRRNSHAQFGAASSPRRVAGSDNQTERSGSSITSLVLWGAIVFVAIIVISSLFRRIGGAAGGVGGGVGVPGTGGGGFLSSLFGGIAGAMAGSWLYDRFFGDHHSGDGNWTSAGSSGSDVGSDFASSGADVDDSSRRAESDFGSSGGDTGIGSDDFGGGDFGGGDSGGSGV